MRSIENERNTKVIKKLQHTNLKISEELDYLITSGLQAPITAGSVLKTMAQLKVFAVTIYRL